MNLGKIIDASLGKIECDLILKNAKIIDVFSSRIIEGEIAIYDGIIVGVNDSLEGKEVIDLDGKYISPGFFDSHVHIESSMLTPSEYANVVIPHGTTSVVVDPHEIANVLGYDGIKFMLNDSENIPLNVYFMISSCVPATNLDTSGASLFASDMYQFKKFDRVKGLAEVMNYPGVINKDPQLMDKIALFSDMVIDGHAPMVRGKGLSAYILAGISSDHECTILEEAEEKLSKGMYIMIREGSTAKDLNALYPIISDKTKSRLMVCTDDKHPDELKEQGHINYILKKLVRKGVEPITAIQLATINPATYFRIKREGAIAPGYFADIVVLDNLDNFIVDRVFIKGILIAENGRMIEKIERSRIQIRDTVNIKWLEEKDFKIKDTGKKVRIIKANKGSLITEQIIDNVKSKNGFLESDIERDYLKIFVIERHFGSGNIGKGFINGLGLKRGAIGSTISHDSHNMIIVGVDDQSIFKAAKYLNKVGGGIVITDRDKIVAELPLPVGGLMSDRDVDFVSERLKKFEKEFIKLKTNVVNPLMTLSFVALPVIPHLKITDKGLVDVNKFDYVSLYVD